jgi:ZIP family zinc transporter
LGLGTLFSALSFELMDAAYKQGGFTATAIGFVAGAILAMLSDTMIPEAFQYAHNFTGLITVLGFLVAFMLSKYGG